MFNDLLNLGMTQNKSKTVELSIIPDKHFSHFVRGYFDGDGNVLSGYFRKPYRKNKSYTLRTRFTSGSRLILDNLKIKLKNIIRIDGSVNTNIKEDVWRLNYGLNDYKKLFRFMYSNDKVNNLIYLERKYKIYKNAGVV